MVPLEPSSYAAWVAVSGAKPILLLGGLLGLGCVSHVEHGRSLYTTGHYVEAEAVFDRNVSVLDGATAREQTQYATYRGLTLLALGDAARAQEWLSYAYSVEQRYPGALQPRVRAELDRGWFELMARLAPPAQAPPQDPALAQGSQQRGPAGPAPASGSPAHASPETRRSLVGQ
jgi:hypothetical protein